MKNLKSAKNVLTFFIFLILTTGIFNVHAAESYPPAYATESEPPIEEYAPELTDDGSVIFKKKSESTAEGEPVIKLRGAALRCCKKIRVGQTILNLCKKITAKRCPRGTRRK